MRSTERSEGYGSCEKHGNFLLWNLDGEGRRQWVNPGGACPMCKAEKKDGRNGGKNTEHGIHSSKELEKRLHFSSGGWLMDVLARTPSIIPRGSQQE
nr:MAG TPA: hypothetical protein [Caudoviricetes sp.]